MKIDRAGFPFILAALAPAIALFILRRAVWAAPFLGLSAFFAYFFRDPDRVVPQTPGAVIAPADGRVQRAGDAEPGAALPGDWQQVTIFLSPLDVHINRMPVSGRVRRVEYCPGRFLPAYRPESCENERTELWIDHDGQSIVVRQVVGVLARRIVCRVQQGAEVRTGDRFGLMKFGSRTDVFLPRSAKIQVSVGQHVRGGETIIATL